MQTSSNFQVYNASAGSGKTFTLVKEYLKIIISESSPFVFQKILAITFTNKAAGEMKERVLKNLDAFANGKENDMLLILEKESGIDRSVIFERSRKAIDAILQNYASFSITTIDSFTHKLIRTFAYDLQLPMNFEVEMDGEQVLSEAVDMVVSKIGSDSKVTKLLVDYSLDKLADDKAWDISGELKEFSKVLLNENHTERLKSLKHFSADDFKRLNKNLKSENDEIAQKFIAIGNEGMSLIDALGLDYKAFSYADLPNHFIKLQNFRKKAEDLKFEGRLFNTIEAKKPFYKASATAAVKNEIEGISNQCRDLYYQSMRLYEQYFSTYLLNKYVVESLIPLAVLNYINSSLTEYKEENNILLNAEFNTLISEEIKDEPAPFIYERIGEQYRYYFIDEMQDTSEMQWQNLIPLLSHALSSQDEKGAMGSLMLVGDGKQSIYRWRGGKAEQFIALTSEDNLDQSNPFYVSKTVSNLETNFRSYSKVIDFNNAFFTHLSQYFGNTNFSQLYEVGNKQLISSKVGGYVEMSFVEFEKGQDDKDLVYPRKVLEVIQGVDLEFNRSEICVLVRTKKQGVSLANYLTEQGVEIISSETLLLQHSQKVKFILNALTYLNNESDKEVKVKLCYFLYDFLNIETGIHEFIDARIDLDSEVFFESFSEFGVCFNKEEFYTMSLTQGVEYLIRCFRLLSESDSNVQFFLDVIFEFQQKQESSIASFLEYWELKKEKLSIVAPEAKNAVRIMTIHKSKGLEFPIVIFPYDLNIYRQINPKVWYEAPAENGSNSSFLIKYNQGLERLGEQGKLLYRERRDELELDNFNLLYVALTRAEEQLYVIGELPSSNKKNELTTTSQFYKSYLEASELWNDQKTTYSFGEKNRDSRIIEADVESEFQKEFVSSSWEDHQINIVANSSLLWDTEQGEAIEYGNLIHALMGEIKYHTDVEVVLEKYVGAGKISLEECEVIQTLILKIVNHSLLKSCFDEDVEVICEQEILTTSKQIVIPDRIVFIGNQVVIIDYKTGKKDKKYHDQINYYAKTLGDLGYRIYKKYLVYIDEEIFVEEV